jgi:8-oxo-dGTP pyrophosphatase MutT (NUDIX family)
LEFFFVKHGKTGRWTFPKGHQELGETLVETAIREIREEAGLVNLRYVASVGKTSFRYRREDTTIQKTVQFFLFEAAPDAKEVLTGEEAIWEAVWVPVEKVYETVGYQNLRRLLARAVRQIDDRPRQGPRPPMPPGPRPNPGTQEPPRRRFRVHF